MSDAHDPFSGAPAGGPPPPPGYQPPQPQYPSAPPQPQYPPTQAQPQYPPAAPQPQYPPTQAQPQYPPAAPQPQYPPTQAQPQYAPTQQMPGAGYGPGPMPGYGAPAPTSPAPKKTGLMVGAGVAVAALVGGGAFLLLGGDDEKSTTPTPSSVSVVTTIAGGATTVPVASSTPATTVVLTQPPTTVAVTVAPTAAPTTPSNDVGRVTDELGVFSVIAPDGFETDTSSITSGDGITVASVIVADSVDGFKNNHDTSGFQVFVADIASDVSAASLLSFIEPGEGECSSVSQNLGYPTSFGGALMNSYSGCGPNASDKRVIVVEVPAQGVVIGIYFQEAPSEVDLTNVATIVLESVQLL